jgi:hypothetical protein
VLERHLLPLVVFRNSLATPYHVRILFLQYGGRQEAGAIHSVRPIRTKLIAIPPANVIEIGGVSGFAIP